MKIARVTAAVFALVLLGSSTMAPRPAGASPCKPDGQACRTNQSCCGTNGHNGLCVNSSPPGKRPAGACCTPTTCEAAGAQCGSIANGTCLTLAPLNCGTCPDDEVCTPDHVCETTTTTTTTSTSTTTTIPIPPCGGVAPANGCIGSCSAGFGSCVATDTGLCVCSDLCSQEASCLASTANGEPCSETNPCPSSYTCNPIRGCITPCASDCSCPSPGHCVLVAG